MWKLVYFQQNQAETNPCTIWYQNSTQSRKQPYQQIMFKNLNRENIGKSVTIADKIRMAMTNLTKNKIDPQNIEPETATHKVSKS